jgi:ABC-type uncharacterized transport system ATPase subunit
VHLDSEFSLHRSKISKDLSAMQMKSLGRKGLIHPLDLEIRPGEVLGLAGLLGSGRTETAVAKRDCAFFLHRISFEKLDRAERSPCSQSFLSIIVLLLKRGPGASSSSRGSL